MTIDEKDTIRDIGPVGDMVAVDLIEGLDESALAKLTARHQENAGALRQIIADAFGADPNAVEKLLERTDWIKSIAYLYGEILRFKNAAEQALACIGSTQLQTLEDERTPLLNLTNVESIRGSVAGATSALEGIIDPVPEATIENLLNRITRLNEYIQGISGQRDALVKPHQIMQDFSDILNAITSIGRLGNAAELKLVKQHLQKLEAVSAEAKAGIEQATVLDEEVDPDLHFLLLETLTIALRVLFSTNEKINGYYLPQMHEILGMLNPEVLRKMLKDLNAAVTEAKRNLLAAQSKVLKGDKNSVSIETFSTLKDDYSNLSSLALNLGAILDHLTGK